MRIGPSIPFHVARAYGVPAAPVARPAAPPASVAPTAPARQTTPSASLDRLVGGTVPRGVDFDSASTPAAPRGPVLQLYTRAADRIEAATGIELGRTLDVSG